MDEILSRDQNRVTVLAGVTDDANQYITMLRVDPVTKRLKVSTTGLGSGTVTSVSVATANGFAGTVATATTTPVITISTTVTGVLSGNGTAISAASTTGSGTVVLATSPTLVTPILGTATATTLNGNTFTTGTYTLTGQAGKTLTFNGSITLSGTDAQTYTFPTTTATIARTDAAQTFTGAQTFSTTIVGSVNGNAATVTTNANLTGAITSSGNATSLGSFSSANLATALTDETGTGANVFASKPTFIGTINTIVAVAALALDGSLGSIFTKTIASPSTFTQSNFSTGQCFILKVTGAQTITWFSGITWITSGAAAPTQAAITTYGFVCTGSNTFDGYLVGTQ